MIPSSFLFFFNSMKISQVDKRAFYFFTADGVDSNVGASIDIQDLRVYALSEEYDEVHK